jgi:hypothetical protein
MCIFFTGGLCPWLWIHSLYGELDILWNFRDLSTLTVWCTTNEMFVLDWILSSYPIICWTDLCILSVVLETFSSDLED